LSSDASSLSLNSSDPDDPSSSLGVYRRTNIWTKIANQAKQDANPWDKDEDADPEDDPWYDPTDPHGDNREDSATCGEAVGLLCAQRRSSIRRTLSTLKSHPSIILAALALFGVLCTSGLLAARQMASSHTSTKMDAAHDVGVETAQWFQDEFDRLLMPMFTVSQFVKMTDTFRELRPKLDAALEKEEGVEREEAVQQVCTDPTYLAPFKQLIDGIRADADLDGILFNVRLSPGATTCLIDRATNTDDYADEQWTYDATGQIGHNWIGSGHPMMEAIIRQTILDDVVTVAGPWPLTNSPSRPWIYPAMISGSRSSSAPTSPSTCRGTR